MAEGREDGDTSGNQARPAPRTGESARAAGGSDSFLQEHPTAASVISAGSAVDNARAVPIRTARPARANQVFADKAFAGPIPARECLRLPGRRL